MKIKMIEEKLGTISPDELNGTTVDASNRLASLKYPGYSNIRISYDCGYDGPGEYLVYGTRPETEKERDRRFAERERARKARLALAEKKREIELAEYERLKKKYGA